VGSVLAVSSTTGGTSTNGSGDPLDTSACGEVSIWPEFSGSLDGAGGSIVGCGSCFLRNNNISVPAFGFVSWGDKCPALNHTARPYEVVKGMGDRSASIGFRAMPRQQLARHHDAFA
jgi:hypothetical protein